MDIQFVRNILTNAEDVSVNSPELSRAWVNETTEYHLNPDRTNILQALHFEPGLNILEVGCSSGILSRYLGEQGHRVVAMKTGTDCLEAAKLRCADLPNVIFAATPDEITAALEASYDAVLLLPPLPKLVNTVLQTKVEKKEGKSGAEETAASLRIFMNTLSGNGVLIIGTGNRLGLKYWLGASEEHYGRPYVGLWGYGSPDQSSRMFSPDQSPRMFSRNEWLEILSLADIATHRFLYPFPDHQFADLIVSDEFVRGDPNAHSLLYRTKSRDLSTPDWLPDQDEFLHWKSLHQSGYLSDFVNSFLIVAAKSQEPLANIFPYDFIKLSKSSQHCRYHTVTYKEQQQPFVVKKRVNEKNTEDTSGPAGLSHAPATHGYIQGPLLAELWIDALVMGDKTGDFKNLLSDYYQFLNVQLEQAERPGQYLDLLPFNIILAENGQYRYFDQEWAVDCSNISPEFILFRALLWFGFAHDTHISCRMIDANRDENLSNLSEFITFCFQLLSLDHQTLLPGFIEQEGAVQHSIDSTQGIEQVRALLHQPFQQSIRAYQTTQFDTQLFWVTETSPLSGEHCLNVRAHMGREQQTLFFILPDSVERLKILRFDPADKLGFLHIHRLTLRQAAADSEEGRILWEAIGSSKIAETAILENMHYCSSTMRDVFFSVGKSPQIIIELPEFVTEQSGQGRLQFEAVIDWPQSFDYFAVLDEMRTQRRLLIEMKERSHRREEENQRRIEEMHENKALMRQRIAVLEHKLDAIRRTCIGRFLSRIKFSPFQF